MSDENKKYIKNKLKHIIDIVDERRCDDPIYIRDYVRSVALEHIKELWTNAHAPTTIISMNKDVRVEYNRLEYGIDLTGEYVYDDEIPFEFNVYWNKDLLERS